MALRLGAIPGVRGVSETAPGRLRMLCDRDVRPEAAAAVVVGRRAPEKPRAR